MEIFIDADNFDYKKYEKKRDFDLRSMNCENANYVLVKEIESSQKTLCKIYNPRYLFECRSKGSKIKADQPWYSQLQILREAFLIQKLNHPGIVAFYGLNLYNDQVHFQNPSPNEGEEVKILKYSPSLFLEYTSMKSIQNHISKGKLDETLSSPVRRQILIIGITAAVRCLHKKNIVHRNLCPESIWLDKNLYPKIYDFSHSREFNEENTQENAQENINVTYRGSNKCMYQAPEDLNGEIQYKFLKELDIFSLGRLLYLLITGIEVFTIEKSKKSNFGSFQIGQSTTNGILPHFPKTISENWEYIIKYCWKFNPTERPSAENIYYLAIDENFYISDFNSKELEMIEKYKKLIQDHEDKKKVSLSDPVIFQMKFEDYKFKDLYQLFKNKTVEQNEDLFLEIINNLIEKEDEDYIYNNYLPKIMKYVVKFLKNNFAAKNFINKAFGEPIKLKNNKNSIQIGDTSKDVKELNISTKITHIGSHAFSGYEKLERVFIPDSVQVIEDEAFSECKQLKYVYLPKSIKGENLGKGVFRNCPQLNNIIIPEDLTTIKESSFEGDKKLEKIKLNDKLLKIDSKAFSGCCSLISFKIPESVISIGKKVFQSCGKLEKIEFPGVKKSKIISISCGLRYSKY